MRKVLLDCGSHQGGGLRGMIKENNMDPTWVIHSWEANPHAHRDFNKKFQNSNFKINSYNAAVGHEDGTITVNIQAGNGPASGKGTSIMSLDEWRPVGTKPFIETAEVPMINFSKWMLDNLKEDDYVVLKMDIEGAEYNVLEKVIESGASKFINKIYIEWHSTMFTDKESYKKREDKIKEHFSNNNIEVYPW